MRALGDWPPGVRAVAAVGATCVFMVLVAWATLLGPDQVFTGPGPQSRPAPTTAESCIPLPVVTNPDGSTSVDYPDDYRLGGDYCDPPPADNDDYRELVEDNPPPFWLRLLLRLLLAALVAVLAIGLVLLLVAVVRALLARRREDPRAEVAFAVLGEPARVAAEVARDADEQDMLLRDGDARNAIVAAWHRFEVQGERAGVPRRASETSSEYALRVLDLADADTGPVQRLAELYREARFSEHPITEAHRSEALAALAGIRDSLGARA